MQKCLKGVVRVPSHHKTHSALDSVFLYVAQTLLKKVVVPQIRVGIAWNYRKENHHRKTEHVSGMYRDIERRIVEDAHRPLHPVGNALTSLERCSGPPN